MEFINRIEKFVFYLVILVSVVTIILNWGLLPKELQFVNFCLILISGIYYFPLLVIAQKYEKMTKESLILIASGFLILLSCIFIAVFQFIQVDHILLFGEIVAFLNGVFYFYFLLTGKKYRGLFVRHFIINLLLIGILI